jgi:hypothetical protein
VAIMEADTYGIVDFVHDSNSMGAMTATVGAFGKVVGFLTNVFSGSYGATSAIVSGNQPSSSISPLSSAATSVQCLGGGCAVYAYH